MGIYLTNCGWLMIIGDYVTWFMGIIVTHSGKVRGSLRNASSGIASERALMHRFRTRLLTIIIIIISLHQVQQDINPKGVVALLTSSATRHQVQQDKNLKGVLALVT